VLTRYDAYAAFVERRTVTATAVSAGGVSAFGLLVLYAVWKRRSCLCLCGYWALILITLALVALTLFLGYWVWTTDDIPVDSINSLRGTDLSQHVQRFDDWLARELAVPLSVVEGAVCSTYTMCCRDPALGVRGAVASGNVTCIAPQEGLTSDLEVTLQDPSSPNFCAYVTGAPPHLLVEPPRGVCDLLDRMLDGFSLSQCQEDFCGSGIDAYITFVNQMVALIQQYAVPLAAAMGVLVLLLVIWACNVRYVGKRLRDGDVEVKSATNAAAASGRKAPTVNLSV